MASILDTAMANLGTPYKWGGAQPGGFDCSGLLQYAFAQHGVAIPRVSRDQAAHGTPVSIEDARPGDLVAFDNSAARPGVDHIGIYLGDGKMLHAPRTGKTVEIVEVNLSKAVTIRRVLPESAYDGMRASDGRYVYRQGMSATGNTNPTTITAANGGGDQGMAPSRVWTADDYGFAQAFFKSDPELKALVDRAVAEQWDANKFQIELQNTAWFTARTESEREYVALETSDPNELRRKKEKRAQDLRAMGNQMGVKLTDAQYNKLAEDSLRYGYSDQEVRNNLASYVKLLPGRNDMVGDAGALLDKYRQKARAYGLTIPDGRITEFVKEVMSGANTEESFDLWIKEQAKALYPNLGKFIDAGLTIEDIASNYQQRMAQVLELDPTTIDLQKDPLLRQALFYQDPKAKPGAEGAPMSMWDFEKKVKSDPRWLQTNNARDTMMGITGDVLRDFGFKF